MNKLVTLVIIIFCCSCTTGNARIRYVNIAATGTYDGTSWANAYKWLDTALDNLYNGNDTFWVANGTYTASPFGSGYGCTFPLFANQKLYGGFAGTETSLSQRNYSTYQTVLSGSNTQWTVQSIGLIDQRLDGFKIINGNPYGVNAGAALSGKFVMENCLLTANTYDGGLFISGNGGTADIINCQFISNGHSSSTTAGAAIKCTGTTINVTNCLFKSNQAAYGSVYCFGNSTLNITGCLFKNNQAGYGGGIYQKDSGRVSVNRCIFYGNTASVAGGAIYDESGAKLRVFNSLIVGNASPLGAAHYSADSLRGYHNFTHCTIANNWGYGSASPNYALWLRNPRDTLRNSILWGDSTGAGAEIASPKTGAVFSKNLIKGGATLFGTTNTYTFNPLFISPGTAAAAPFPATSAYNYHLFAQSEAVDTGANLGLVAPLHLDLDSHARAQGPWPDLGAYEWKACPWLNVTITLSGPTTFCQPGSVILTASANPLYTFYYQWNLGTQTGTTITVTTSGINKVVVVDSLGCRSAAAVTVNAVAAPSPVITQAGNTLSVPAIYATYQWYLNGNIVSGATSATYTSITYGNYTVKVTTVAGGCPGTSAVYNFRNLAVGGTALEHALRIYPNPGDGHLNISFEGQQALGDLSITVTDITGQQVFRQQYHSVDKEFFQEIDVSGAAKGVYFIEVAANGERLVRRVSIQ